MAGSHSGAHSGRSGAGSGEIPPASPQNGGHLQAPRSRSPTMRGLLAVVIVCCSLQPHRTQATETAIPAHPRDLQLVDGQVTLPAVENRRQRLASGPVVYLAADPTLPLVEISVAVRAGAFSSHRSRPGCPV